MDASKGKKRDAEGVVKRDANSIQRPPVPPLDLVSIRLRSSGLIFPCMMINLWRAILERASLCLGIATGWSPLCGCLVTSEGNSILVHVHGFTPYFMASIPPGFTVQQCAIFRQRLNERIRSEMRIKRYQSLQHFCVHVDVVQRQNIYGYSASNAKRDYLRVYMALPNFVPGARRILERGFDAGCGHGPLEHRT